MTTSEIRYMPQHLRCHVAIQPPVPNSELNSHFIFSPTGFHEHENTYHDFYFRNYPAESEKTPLQTDKNTNPSRYIDQHP